MGQKIHPVGLRLGITRTWDSRWFEKRHYREWLHEDVAIRKFFARMTRAAAISRVEIERRANQARIVVHTAKPGIIIGKRGVGIEDIKKNLEQLTGKTVQVNVMEIKHPELDGRLVAQNIVDQLEKRIAFRRAMKQAIMRTMKAGARGIKVQISGRLGGSEIARSERNHDGKVPLHTLRADIDYAHVEAFTTFGRIGVKVWIYKGEVLAEQATERQRERTSGSERGVARERREQTRRASVAATRESIAAPTIADVASTPSDVQSPPSAGEVMQAADQEVSLGDAVGESHAAAFGDALHSETPTPESIAESREEVAMLSDAMTHAQDPGSVVSAIDGAPPAGGPHSTGAHSGLATKSEELEQRAVVGETSASHFGQTERPAEGAPAENIVPEEQPSRVEADQTVPDTNPAPDPAQSPDQAGPQGQPLPTEPTTESAE